VRLHDLIDYNDLNKEGFRKALKKHDKVLAWVAPKRLEEQRPRWESVLSKKSKEKLEVCGPLPPPSPPSISVLSKVDLEKHVGLSSCIPSSCPHKFLFS